MDAFSVSIANGLSEPQMRRLKCAAVAGAYSIFQFLMPMLGWALVTALVSWFGVIQRFVPYIARTAPVYRDQNDRRISARRRGERKRAA